ncbi:hypothetical protein [Microlunatus elymi]|uniref:hypothetical protein n=1 Tax=Microlunatus elymi TaxID=2596828 RepID=UPI00143DA17F|nr:hypothetical protein [Microlunatus elymi]
MLDLSLSQVIGGALAAMTAAALGSRLGVAGTLIGAALASVVASVAGSLYTSGIRHTRAGVGKAIQHAAPRSRTAPPPNATALSQPTKVTLTESIADSAVIGRAASITLIEDDPEAADPWAAGDQADRSETGGSRTGAGAGGPDRPQTGGVGSRNRKRLFRGSLVGAIAVFVIALAAIAGYELIVGHSLDGQPGGTTVGRAVSGGSSGQHKSDTSSDSDHKKSDDSNSTGTDGKSGSTDQNDQQKDDPSGAATGSSDAPSGNPSSDSGSASGTQSSGSNSSSADTSGNSGTDSNSGSDSSGDSSNSGSGTDSGSSGSGNTDSGVSGSNNSGTSTDNGSGNNSQNSQSDAGGNSDSGTSSGS